MIQFVTGFFYFNQHRKTMKNVSLSKEQVEEVQHTERQEELVAEASAPKRKLAGIIGNQSPIDFEIEKPVVKEPVVEEPVKEVVDPAKAVEPKKETKEETLAQENGEEEAKKADSKPLLPEFLTERLAQEFPDEKFENPEEAQAFMDRIISDAKALEAERAANDKLYNLFENSDEMVAVAKHMNSGRSFLEAIALSVNIEEALADLKETQPEEYKKVIRAQVERENNLKAQADAAAALEKQFTDNGEASKQNIEAFKAEKKLEADAGKDFLGIINKHFGEMVQGVVSPEYLHLIHKGLNYEADLATAKEQGLIEGKNQLIDIEKVKKQGDSLPVIPRGTSTSTEAPTASRGKRALAKLALNSQSSF